MQTLNNSELNAVVGGCCASGNYVTAPDERVITLPIPPGANLFDTEATQLSSQAFAE